MATIQPVYGIIFDLMGTLATYTGTRAELETAWRHGGEELYRHLMTTGLDVPPEEFARRLQETFDAHMARHGGNPREISVEAVVAEVLQSFGQTPAPEQIEAAARAYFGPEMAGWQIMPGAAEAVETLNAEGFRLAVVSNSPSHLFLEEAVAKIGLRPFFSPVMSSARAGARKPDPALFLAVAREWQLDPATVVVVGDGLRADIEGAHAAGMRGILVHSGENPENATYDGPEEPYATLSHVSEVPALIDSWQRAVGEDTRPETGFIEDY